MSAYIQLDDVVKTHRSGAETICALNHVTADINQGEFVAVMGPSGSGKSTLLNLIGGLDAPDSGEIIVSGNKLTAMAPKEKAKLRRTLIGYVFQDYNLIPTLTLAENVALPLELDGQDKTDARKLALDTLAIVQLDDAANRFPAEVSRGQAQRAVIARACIGDNRVLLADEPTGALDTNLSEEVMRILRKKADSGSTIVLVTHEPRFAGWADRVIYLRDGKIDPNHSEGA